LAAFNVDKGVESSGYDTWVGLLYKNYDEIPENVGIKTTGQDSQNVSLLIVHREYIERRTSRSTIRNAQRLARKIKRIEVKEPEKAKALRHAGVIVKSEDLEEAVAQLEK